MDQVDQAARAAPHIPVESGCVTLVSKDMTQIWQVWMDGRIAGFPPGTILLNGAAPYLHKRVAEAWLRGKEHSTLKARLTRVAAAFARALRMRRSLAEGASRP